MDPFDTTVLIFTLIIFLFGSFFNAVALLVYLKSQRNYPSAVLLVFLTIVQFLSSFLIVPFIAVSELKLIKKSLVYCQIYMFFLYGTNALPVTLLPFIAFDRLKIMSQSIGRKINFEFNSIRIVIFNVVSVLVVISLPIVWYVEVTDTFVCRNIKSPAHDYFNISMMALLNIISMIVYFKIFLIVHKNIFLSKINTITAVLEQPNKSTCISSVARKDWKVAKMFILVI